MAEEKRIRLVAHEVPAASSTPTTLLRSLLFDLRVGIRTLARAPGFALAVVLVLALGVGLNGAIFTAIRAALLAPPPYPDPERLVLLDLSVEDESGVPAPFPWSWPKYRLLEASELPLESRAGYAVRSLTMTGTGTPLWMDAEVITPSYFRVLRVPLALGRPFSEEDTGPAEAVLSDELWRTRFGSDSGVVGSAITLNGHPTTIVGVGASGFAGLSGRARLWIPVRSVTSLVSPVLLRLPNAHWLLGIGRLSEGASLAQLQPAMRILGSAVQEQIPLGGNSRASGDARSLIEARRHPRAETAVLAVAAGALFVLLAGSANIAALNLTRGRRRRYETAVRLALGGSRGRVATWLMSEAVLLAFAGAVVGTCLSALAVPALGAAWPDTFHSAGWNLAFVSAGDFAFDGSTLLFTLGLAAVACLFFGVAPAVRLARRTDLGITIKSHSASAPGPRARLGPALLVAGEVALALLLIVGSGLMVSSLDRLLDVEPGFDSTNVLTFRYSLPAETDDAGRFTAGFLDRIRRLPGVISAADGCVPPAGGHCSITVVSRAGDRVWEPSEGPHIGGQVVDEHYFETLRISLLEGRSFESSDRFGGPPVVVISRRAARELFGDRSPLGQPFSAGMSLTGQGRTAEIIGVVGDVLYGPPEEGVMPEVYYLQRQDPELNRTVVVRSEQEPLLLVAAVQRELNAMNPLLPIHGITTLGDLAAAQVGDTRLVARLLTLFSVLALVMAVTGIWGLVSAAVTSRRRELGIRMALGARSGGVVRLVMKSGAWALLAGAAAGSLAAVWGTAFLRGLLYEVSPADPVVLLGANALIVAVVLAAAWIPARRATRVNAAETLRSE